METNKEINPFTIGERYRFTRTDSTANGIYSFNYGNSYECVEVKGDSVTFSNTYGFPNTLSVSLAMKSFEVIGDSVSKEECHRDIVNGDGKVTTDWNHKKEVLETSSTENDKCLMCVENVSVDDRVDHPSHYTWLKEKCGIEVIDITRHMDFDMGNAVKYLLRAGYKSEMGYGCKEKMIEDLRKAVWYINDKIRMLRDE